MGEDMQTPKGCELVQEVDLRAGRSRVAEQRFLDTLGSCIDKTGIADHKSEFRMLILTENAPSGRPSFFLSFFISSVAIKSFTEKMASASQQKRRDSKHP
jgi:hypothetical protein